MNVDTLKDAVFDYISQKERTRQDIFAEFKDDNPETIRGILSKLKTTNQVAKKEIWFAL